MAQPQPLALCPLFQYNTHIDLVEAVILLAAANNLDLGIAWQQIIWKESKFLLLFKSQRKEAIIIVQYTEKKPLYCPRLSLFFKEAVKKVFWPHSFVSVSTFQVDTFTENSRGWMSLWVWLDTLKSLPSDSTSRSGCIGNAILKRGQKNRRWKMWKKMERQKNALLVKGDKNNMFSCSKTPILLQHRALIHLQQLSSKVLWLGWQERIFWVESHRPHHIYRAGNSLM